MTIPVTIPPLPEATRAGRDALGRFGPGNPGRPKGARGRVAGEVEKLLLGAAPEIARLFVEVAQERGDYADRDVQRWILEFVVGRTGNRGRTVEIEGFPKIETPADVPVALARIAEAAAAGDLSLSEATAMADMLEKFLSTFESAHRTRPSGILPPPR